LSYSKNKSTDCEAIPKRTFCSKIERDSQKSTEKPPAKKKYGCSETGFIVILNFVINKRRGHNCEFSN
jgi:hypothetical protein